MALIKHVDHPTMVQGACRVLTLLGTSDQALQRRIKEAGAEPLLRAAIAMPNATDKTKCWAKELLEKLGKL